MPQKKCTNQPTIKTSSKCHEVSLPLLETRQKSITFNLFKAKTHPIIPKSLSFQHHLTICGMGPKSVHRKVRQLRHEKWTKLSRCCPNVTCTGSARLKSLLPEQFQTSTNLVKLSRLPCVECAPLGRVWFSASALN